MSVYKYNKLIDCRPTASSVLSSRSRTTVDEESDWSHWIAGSGRQLGALEPWVRHRDIAAQRVDSVGGWLLETKEFRRWHRGSREDECSHATLFCDGNPGAGKSYIASLVIDKLCDEAEEDDSAVVCFYFDFAARSEQSLINMLGSLLRQLVSGLDGIHYLLVSLIS
ncbi:hypothetical protein HOY82DRAFT_595992 [Tuber indicum]|nr:hypothetical protein HOY82DRAFT_595992 [Tuber indicum]